MVATRSVHALIIGGGVIGVAAALDLVRHGLRVTLVEAGAIGHGCSYGNAGLIVPSSSLPLATPEALRSGLRWLLDGRSPLRIRLRAEPELLSWLARFALACRETRVRGAVPRLRALGEASRRLYEELAGVEGAAFHYQRRGWLYAYRTPEGLEEGLHQAERVAEGGVPFRRLSAAELAEAEPALVPGLAGGVLYPEDAHLDPYALTLHLAGRARAAGAELLTRRRVTGWRTEGARIRAVATEDGELEADHFVLAAGVWSAPLGARLGLRLPVQPAKGYSLTLPLPEGAPTRPLMLGEAHVVATPMGDNLRLTGGLDLVGFDPRPEAARLQILRRAARGFLPGVAELREAEAWAGYRPLTPDGMPLIGPTRRYGNLLLATGHGTLGVTLAPVTARLLAHYLTGAESPVDPEPYLPARLGL